ncbi:PAS domain-containing protein [Methylobacterium komagatae]
MPHRSIMRPASTGHADEAVGRGLSSRHFLKLIEDSIDIGLWSSEINEDRIHGSLGLYRVLGLDPAVDLTFGIVADMMHPEDRRAHGPMLSLLRSGQAIERDFRIIRPDRTQRWVRSRAEVIVDAVGRPSHALGIIKDVTGRHEARRSLEIEHDRFKALLDATAAVYWVNSSDGRAHDMPQWGALTGQSHEQMQGSGWIDALHPDDRARAQAAWTTAVAHASPYNTDYRVLCKDGIYRWFNARGTPILNHDGSVREWVGVCLSIAGQNRVATRQGTTTNGINDLDTMPITPAQIRAARALVGMSADEVARRASISISTMRRMETEASGILARADNLLAVRQVFEQAGVVFTFNPKPGLQFA